MPGSFWMLVWLSLGALTFAPAGNGAESRRKVIIDQDAFGPGGPNQQPILMLLQSADVEVLGITIESGDGWQKENVAHTLRMLELVGRTDVPVVPGATFPLLNSQERTRRWEATHGKLVYKGAWQETWSEEVLVRRPRPHAADELPPLVEGDPKSTGSIEIAAHFITRQVREHPGEVTILALGPMTNLALATRLDESLATNARELVLMGGSFSPSAANDSFALEYVHAPRLEFNFRWDPEAASMVLHAPWKRVVQIPVDPSTRTRFTPEMVKAIAAADTPVSRYVAKWAEPFPLWDEIAAAVWLRPAIAKKTVALAIDVDTGRDSAGYGNTLSWPPASSPGLGECIANVVTEVDVTALNALVVELLGSGQALRQNAQPSTPEGR